MNLDDPRLTAHALGELDSPEEIASLEALLRDDPAAAAELEKIRSFTQQLRTELRGEAADPLTPSQRAAILQAASGTASGLNGTPVLLPSPQGQHRTWSRRPWIPSAIAACVVVGSSIAVLQTSDWFRPKALVVTTAPTEPQQEDSAGIKAGISLDGAVAPAADDHERLFAPVDELAPAPERGDALPVDTLAPDENAFHLGSLSSAAPAAANPAEPALPMPESLIRSDKDLEEVVPPARTTAPLGLVLRKAETAERLPAPLAEGAKVLTLNNPTPESSTAVPGQRGASGEVRLLSDSSTSAGEKVTLARPEVRRMAASSAVLAPSAAPATATQGVGSIAGRAATQSYGGMGGGVASTESPGTFLGKDYKLRNFAEERESEVRQTVPGKPQAASPALEDPTGHALAKGMALSQVEQSNTESYDAIQDNPFQAVGENPLSTFSIDVDTASYSNVRRFLQGNQRPPKGAVRIEELLNYFSYAYPVPQGDDPFSCTMEVAVCPWAPGHRLMRVGLKGREVSRAQRPPANLVFLVDVSGSMQPTNKLPLVKESLHLLVSQLDEKDTVGITVYAGASGTVLEPTSDKAAIRAALDRLESGGSTNGAAGIQLAYEMAQRGFRKDGLNRVILATDGDFNVGVTNQSELVDLIEKKAKSGVFLTALGFGYGNLKDSTLEKLADKGNGNYAYIDSPSEGRKVLVEQMAGTLMTIAKDVKIQIEFNPAQVASYRLIGYENRMLRKEDFNDDTKDAGEIGAGHTVTALYEIVPAGKSAPGTTAVDKLKYQTSAAQPPVAAGATAEAARELLTLKLRWKAPEGDKSTLREFPLSDSGLTWERSSRDFRWASAVAGFGMLLRDSPHRGAVTWDVVHELASEGKGEDPGGYRAEFLTLIDKAKAVVR